MGTVRVVTGYVPIPLHPRGPAEYGKLGEEMFGELIKDFPVFPFYEKLKDCWLWEMADKMIIPPTHSVADNPAKNSLEYHCVNHQKFDWLARMSDHKDVEDTLVWLDYGIGHVPGVTVAVVKEFLNRIKENDLAIPGCWTRDTIVLNDKVPCWRFCGGVMVVPTKQANKLYMAVRKNMRAHLQLTKNVSWEVNTLARIEPQLDIRWYQADHNETMFTGY